MFIVVMYLCGQQPLQMEIILKLHQLILRS